MYGPVVKVKAGVEKYSVSQQEDFEKLMAEGKRLYLEEMDEDQALVKFEEAEKIAQTQEQKADVYFYLSLLYYSLWGKGDIDDLYESINRQTLIAESMRKIIIFDYYRELDKSLCPQR